MVIYLRQDDNDLTTMLKIPALFSNILTSRNIDEKVTAGRGHPIMTSDQNPQCLQSNGLCTKDLMFVNEQQLKDSGSVSAKANSGTCTGGETQGTPAGHKPHTLRSTLPLQGLVKLSLRTDAATLVCRRTSFEAPCWKLTAEAIS